MPRPCHPIRLPRALLSAVLPVALAALATPSSGATDASAVHDLHDVRTWDFVVRLDGKPIGHHHFEVAGDAAQRTVRSEASFDVKLLGFSVYRYAFRATERWSGNCLQSLDASTDDDGQPARVHAERDGGQLRIEGPKAEPSPPACVMTWAYWNPEALRRQSRLLDPQTGRIDPVTITPAAPGTIRVGSQDVPAQRFHIAAPAGPVDVWTSPSGQWLGLDAKVRGGRTLSYRLRESPAVPATPDATAASPGAGGQPS